MLLFLSLPFEINKYAEAILDVLLLATLTTPLIYIWIIKPYVNARDAALEEISQLAYIDPLTQLANRRYLLQHLERVSASCIRNKVYGAILLIDLDGFKRVNDTHGHDAGDAVLIETAIRLISSIRSVDIASRLGGDEFVILIDHLDTDKQNARTKAMRVAEKIINITIAPVEFRNEVLQIGASIGLCLLEFDKQNAETLLRKADIAMYRAKNTGKGRVFFAD